MKHADIIKQMTLEEKCYLFSGKDFWQTRSLERLGVPNMTLSDGPHGIRKQAGEGDQLGLNPSLPATCYPTAATVANSWDPVLGEEIGAHLGAEAASQGVGVVLGPGLNVKRSPFCGRNFEYFSEDPYLAGKMAASYIRGIQKNGVSACPKHFAANSQELRRMASDSVMDERTLREIYLTGFEIAVKEGHAKSIMSSYNRINGTYANENGHLLQEILRDEWGFDGFVVSDWGGSTSMCIRDRFRPARELKGFAKVFLKAGESKKVTIPLDDKAFRYFNVDTNKFEVEGGEYQILIGASCADIKLSGAVSVQGTGAKSPYNKEKFAKYFSGDIKSISDAEFEALLGRPIPDGHWSGTLEMNDALCQMYYAKSGLARFAYKILTNLINKSIEKGEPNLNLLFNYNMPFRAIAKMTGGICTMEMAEGILTIVNGHFFKGLGAVIGGFARSGKKRKAADVIH